MSGVTDNRPLAALSLDMDDLWSYLKTAGDPGWKSHPSFMALAMPRLLELLDQYRMGITAFVIGEDVTRPTVRPWLAELVNRGHELGNHSFSHDAAVAYGGPQQIADELSRVEAVVQQAFGVRLEGYRGPSFSYSRDLLSALAERAYRYDASTFPTFLGPLARWYHRLVSRGSDTDGAGSDQLFGSWAEGFRPLRAYRWQLESHSLIELPTTTMPLLRLPVHGTYLHFLADRSEALALAYLRLALWLCRRTGTAPVFLLHASDFLGGDDLAQSSVIPGMRRSGRQKTAFMRRVFEQLTRHYRVVSMRELADSLEHDALPLRHPPVDRKP